MLVRLVLKLLRHAAILKAKSILESVQSLFSNGCWWTPTSSSWLSQCLILHPVPAAGSRTIDEDCHVRLASATQHWRSMGNSCCGVVRPQALARPIRTITELDANKLAQRKRPFALQPHSVTTMRSTCRPNSHSRQREASLASDEALLEVPA